MKPPDLGTDIPITSTAECLSDVGAGLARLLPPESVLVSCIGLLGKVGIAGTTLATNQQINAVVFNERIVLPKFGYYVCTTLRPWMEENSSSTTVAIINKARFSEAPFIVAPLAEQRRIVGKLELLLGKVSSSQQRLSRVPGLLKRFRQSVLAAACSGKLTADWREENPSEVAGIPAESGKRPLPPIADDERLFEAPSTWQWCRLGTLAAFINGDRGKNYPNKNEYVPEDWRS